MMKEQQKKKDAEVDRFYADLWAKDIAIKSQREEETAREQIERNRETLKVLVIIILVDYFSFAVKSRYCSEIFYYTCNYKLFIRLALGKFQRHLTQFVIIRILKFT